MKFRYENDEIENIKFTHEAPRSAGRAARESPVRINSSGLIFAVVGIAAV